LTLGPAERADVIIDFSTNAPGTEIILNNSAPAPFPGTPGAGVIPEVMKFVVVGATGFTDPIPMSLATLETLDPADSVVDREFELRKGNDPCTGTEWQINGLTWHDITEFPRLGTTETWTFINDSGVSHPMHVHLVFFQVLYSQDFQIVGEDINTTGPRVPPPPEQAGWKDTVMVPPHQLVKVIARFEDYAGLYPYHCHILEHEDHEMMRQFRTVVHGDFECMNGPNNAPNPTPPPTVQECLEAFDADFDGDVDLEDFSSFGLEFNGM
jgi:spore coat protein A